MRKVSKIKLNEFSKNELGQRKLNELKGGRRCECYNGWWCQCGDAGDVVGIGNGIANMPDDYIY